MYLQYYIYCLNILLLKIIKRKNYILNIDNHLTYGSPLVEFSDQKPKISRDINIYIYGERDDTNTDTNILF